MRFLRTLFARLLLLLSVFVVACVFSETRPRDASDFQQSNPESIRERILDLRSEIARHDDLYYKKATPEISDTAYDKLKRDLIELERAFPEYVVTLEIESPIGDDRLAGFEKHRHAAPMLSLEKAYSKIELKRFHDRVLEQTGSDNIDYVVEPKIDGIAISVTFENGEFVRAVTRGDGAEGDDVTANVLMIEGIPRRLLKAPDMIVPEFVELRGEVYLTFESFEQINEERESAGETLFSHPRNLAAGSLRLSDSREVARRSLSVVFFGYGGIRSYGESLRSQEAFYRSAEKWGIPVLADRYVVSGFNQLEKAIDSIQSERMRYPFPTDGVVVKVDSIALQEKLGESDFAPRWALAYKFASTQVETRVGAISIQVGRTGLLTPIAELEPVTLSGSQIARATLHNKARIEREDIREGDFVFVEKAGEIIPSIVGINKAKRTSDSVAFEFPSKCPSCSSLLQDNGGGASIRCLALSCPAQLQRRLEYFVSKQGVNIEGLGRKGIADLLELGVVNDFSDVYRLIEEPRLIDDKILSAIEKSKRAELWRFVNGFSIPGIGEVKSRAIAKTFKNLPAIAHVGRSDFEENGIAENLDLGNANISALIDYFDVVENRNTVDELFKLGVRPSLVEDDFKPKSLIALDKVFVITGRLPNLSRRNTIKLIEASGGVVRNSVSGNTDYLVFGENPGRKLEEARSLGVPEIDEAQLIELLNR